MKKTVTRVSLLVLAIVLLAFSLSACGTADDAVTMEKMMEKGAHRTILDTYGSYKVTVTNELSGHSCVEYHDKNGSYFEYVGQGINELFIDGVLRYEMIDGEITAPLSVGMEQVTLDDDKDYLYASRSIEEKIKECRVEGDKQVVETELSKELIDKYIVMDETENIEYVSGRIVYELDKNSLSLISQKLYTTDKEGNETLILTADVIYTFDSLPDNAKKMYEVASQKENLRKVVVITDPGTEEEKTLEVEVPKGIKTSLHIGETYEGVYLDKDCTEKAPPATTFDEDVTYYVKKLLT